MTGEIARPATGREGPRPPMRGAALWAAPVLFLVVLYPLPELVSLYWVRVLAYVLMFACIAQGINLIAGFVGYPAFGNIVFFGIGAYGAGIAMVKLAAPLWAGLLGGLAVSALLVLAIGPLLLRLRGHYFAIATLALNETIRTIVSNVTPLTGGGLGMSLPLPPGSVAESTALFFRAFLVLAALGLFAAVALRRTRFGYGCRAVRANEESAGCLGIDTTFHKTAAWLLSALLTSAAGSVYAYWISYIEPGTVFNMALAVKAFVMFLLGGPATVFGPVAGAAIVEIAAALTWSNLLDYHLALLGVLIMAAVIMIPNGLGVWLRARAPFGLRLSRRV